MPTTHEKDNLEVYFTSGIKIIVGDLAALDMTTARAVSDLQVQPKLENGIVYSQTRPSRLDSNREESLTFYKSSIWNGATQLTFAVQYA